MSDFKQRLQEETSQLLNRLNKLKAFLETDAFKKIDPVQKKLLSVQKDAMETYYSCLYNRQLRLIETEFRSDVKVLQTQSGDWEGLFIDGSLISEGHTLGEGNSKMFMLIKGEEYGFKASDVMFITLSDEDEQEVSMMGSFPDDITKFKTNYYPSK